MRMTAGFLFCQDSVLLVRKTKPDWQAGLWDGIGGKMEDGESPMQAMHREWEEEVGFPIPRWRFLVTEFGPEYSCHFFSYVWDDHHRPKTPERNDAGEELDWYKVADIDNKMVGNLRWLVPMAMDWRGVEGSIQVRKHIKERASW